MAIRAFLFDFDGLIVDTETASRAGWEWLYREHGHELPHDRWAIVAYIRVLQRSRYATLADVPPEERAKLGTGGPAR